MVEYKVKQTKVVLLRTPMVVPKWAHSHSICPPLGLAYLAGVLERLPDVNVLDILDGNFSKNYVYDVVQAVKKHNPDFVGFSAFTPFANPALEAAAAVKEVNPNILTVSKPLGYFGFNSCP